MTQIIERVARAMFEAGPIDATWEQSNEFVGEVLRTYAQAALKELKWDELVGALRECSQRMEDHRETVTFQICQYDEAIADAANLISELEKT